jgi:hypothetical protein
VAHPADRLHRARPAVSATHETDGLRGTRRLILVVVGVKRMDLEQWWNGTDRVKLKYWERKIT